jgi:hypothetical protein
MSIVSFYTSNLTPAIYFNKIWTIGSTTSGACNLNGTDNPDIITTSSSFGTDQSINQSHIEEMMLTIADFSEGAVAMVNSIGYSIDGGKSRTPSDPIVEITQIDKFVNKEIISVMAKIVEKHSKLNHRFFVINRNYQTPYCKIGGQWAHHVDKLINDNDITIKNTKKIKYVLDLGGSSGTFYIKNRNGSFSEIDLLNGESFMSKNNIDEYKKSANHLFEQDPTGKLFFEYLKKNLKTLLFRINKKNLLILQTGKMRNENIIIQNNDYNHMYLPIELEVKYEVIDIIHTLFKGNNVSTFMFDVNNDILKLNNINIIIKL